MISREQQHGITLPTNNGLYVANVVCKRRAHWQFAAIIIILIIVM